MPPTFSSDSHGGHNHLLEGSSKPLYAPLDRSTDSIRLLRILPDTDPDVEVSCIIKTATIDAEYTCLSYCWGERSEQPVRLNGSVVTIRQNLYSFLCEARRRELSAWLWIDALCIDQSNVAERNHQVMQMAAIYTSAKQVIVWLGGDIEYLHNAPRYYAAEYNTFMERVSSERVPPELPIPVRASGHPWPGESLLNYDGRWFIDNLHLFYLCKNPYWSRIWILQEFILAAHLVIWWARDAFPASNFLQHVGRSYYDCENIIAAFHQGATPKILQYHRDIAQRGLDFLDPLHRLTTFRRAYRLDHTVLPTLCDTIVRLNPNRCSDSRDRVYALLSLASDGGGFDVDYQESLEHLYLRLIRHSLQTQAAVSCEAILSLANSIGVDPHSLSARMFPLAESQLPRSWHAILEKQSRGVNVEEVELWALHPPVDAVPPLSGAVARAAHTLRRKLTATRKMCNACSSYTVDRTAQNITDLGTLNSSQTRHIYVCVDDQQSSVGVLEHDISDFTQRSLVAFEIIPDPSRIRWMIVINRGGPKFIKVLPCCETRKCALSEQAWANSAGSRYCHQRSALATRRLSR